MNDTPRTFDVLVTRDTTESTVLRVRAASPAAAEVDAVHFARNDEALTWTRDDCTGDPYIGDPGNSASEVDEDADEVGTFADCVAGLVASPLVLTLDRNHAALLHDAIVMLQPDGDQEEKARANLEARLWAFVQGQPPELPDVNADAPGDPGPRVVVTIADGMVYDVTASAPVEVTVLDYDGVDDGCAVGNVVRVDGGAGFRLPFWRNAVREDVEVTVSVDQVAEVMALVAPPVEVEEAEEVDPVRAAAQAMLDAFGGNVPDWLLEEADRLESALRKEGR